MKLCTYTVLTIWIKIRLDKKIDVKKTFDEVITKVMCWRFLSFLGTDVFLLVNWDCKIHKKQVTENNSKKLMIILQYKKIFQK